MTSLHNFFSSQALCLCGLYICMFSSICFLEPPVQPPSGNLCVPSPCGPNSQCYMAGNTPACSCLPHYVGRAPNCRPECTINAECPSNLACQNKRCRDPCPGSCGVQATCVVVKHSPLCTCQPGFTGDPFTGCSLIPRKDFCLCYSITSSIQMIVGLQQQRF